MMKAELRYDPGVYVAAAKVRVTADRRLNRSTPDRIVRLAAGDLGAVGRWLDRKKQDETTGLVHESRETLKRGTTAIDGA
jgi:hypothetical protein